MINTDSTGKSVLTYEVTGRIARIPIERRGITNGHEWVLGECLLEVFDEEHNGSARLHLITFDELKIEMLNRIGIGKDVRATFHIEVKDRFGGYSDSIILDDISLMTDGENFLIGKKKGEKK